MQVKTKVKALFKSKMNPAGTKISLLNPYSIQSLSSLTSPAKLLTPFLYRIGLEEISDEILKLVTVLAMMLSMLATIDIPMKKSKHYPIVFA